MYITKIHPEHAAWAICPEEDEDEEYVCMLFNRFLESFIDCNLYEHPNFTMNEPTLVWQIPISKRKPDSADV